jgi:hypothetical protein
MSMDRALFRNVHFFDAATSTILGGVRQNGSITEANFLKMLAIVLVTEVPIRVQERISGHIVSMTSDALQTGTYDVYCDGKCLLQKMDNTQLNLARSNSNQ